MSDKAAGRGDAPSSRRDFLKGVAFGGALVGVQVYQGRNARRGTAPALDVEPLSQVTPTDGPRLVHFWATWCGVCHAMEHNIRAFGSGSSDDDSKRERFGVRGEGLVDRREKNFHGVVVDTGPRHGQSARQWGVNAYPTTFVVSSSGEIRDVCVGYTTELRG